MAGEARAGARGLRIELARVAKHFGTGAGRVEVLREVSFAVEPGEAVAIVGPSGSGKSTLLHLLGTLDEPSSGQITLGGQDPFALPEVELARFRNRSIGFVFQDHHLLPQYSVLENVLLPTLAFEAPPGAPQRARRLLDRVGLGHRLEHRPGELSGGERQRASIARALILEPGLMLCDEPTGNLDAASAGGVADLLFELHGQEGNVLVVITHSAQLAGRFGRRLEIEDGRCVEA